MWAIEELASKHEHMQGYNEELVMESGPEGLMCISDSIEEEQTLDSHWYAASDNDSDEDETIQENSNGEVYLTLPRGTQTRTGAQVHSADRTVLSTRNARRQVLDGVDMPPRRERIQTTTLKDEEKKTESSGKTRSAVDKQAPQYTI
jgi:hypothetical protein